MVGKLFTIVKGNRIDGIIKQDVLGLDKIYIQAKRWNGCVGRPEIQKFVGALLGKNAHKGVLLTMGKFSFEAIDYAKNISSAIILIVGQALSELLIKYNVGVTITQLYKLKK
jgi:restriction system protein